MVVLDTDHLSLLDRENKLVSLSLRERLNRLSPELVVTTVVSFEDQMRGWMAILAKSRPVDFQVEAYQRLNRVLDTFCKMPVLRFDNKAAAIFADLQKAKIRIGTRDLKIASIVLANDATLLSRNMVDFHKVPELKVEDWTQ